MSSFEVDSRIRFLEFSKSYFEVEFRIRLFRFVALFDFSNFNFRFEFRIRLFRFVALFDFSNFNFRFEFVVEIFDVLLYSTSRISLLNSISRISIVDSSVEFKSLEFVVEFRIRLSCRLDLFDFSNFDLRFRFESFVALVKFSKSHSSFEFLIELFNFRSQAQLLC